MRYRFNTSQTRQDYFIFLIFYKKQVSFKINQHFRFLLKFGSEA